jgi:hypothetical protein
MSCDFCFVVYNLLPHQHITPRGITLPTTSFFMRPFSTPFTFGPKQMSPEHAHVTMPMQVASAFSGMGGEFLVNADGRFLVFNPTQKNLTYEQILFPSSATHDLTVAAANTHHKITPGSIIVGLDDSTRHDSIFLCFAYFLNAPEKSTAIPTTELVFNAPQVIAHFKKIEPEISKKRRTPWEKIPLTGSALTYGTRLKAPMPLVCATAEPAAPKPDFKSCLMAERRVREGDEAAAKKAKGDEK